MSKLIRVGITHGDTNGVGYEVIMKTFAVPEMQGICTPIIYGSAKAFAYHRKALDMQLNTHNIASAEQAVNGKLNMLNLTDDEIPITLGVQTPEAGAAALTALERAVTDLKEGRIDVLVTAPINKATIQTDDFCFCGHTEYIEQRVRTSDNDSESLTDTLEGNEATDDAAQNAPHDEALMILMNDELRVALVTTHMPLRKVADAVTQEAVVRKLRIFDQALRRDFGITKPRIAVLGLNPHAGDNGLLGDEEQTVLVPAIAEAAKHGVHAYGPYAADGVFGSRAWERYDGVLAMYHDQGLAAFKALAMENGVNYTAGLSVVRTSPDHGTAYDIAGKGVADEASMRNAVYTAIDVYRRRKTYDEAHANPLHKLYREHKENV